MSAKTLTLCDLCGKEMDTGIASKNRRFVEAKSADKTSILSICAVPDGCYPRGVLYDWWHRADVCPECHKKFEQFITICKSE